MTTPTTMNAALDRVFGGNQPEPDATDSIRAPRESDRARNEFRRVAEPVPMSQLGDGEAVDWVWHGYLARGHTTLLTGLWKGGKSTLIGHLLKALESGGELAGNVAAGKVLVISEESRGLWARRRDDLSIGDHVHVVCRPFLGRPRWTEWTGFMEQLAEWVTAGSFGAVVFDTIAPLLPIGDENDSKQMLDALGPLHTVTTCGAAVLLVHHPRKGDAGEGQASRGSGALPGFVDIIVELRRYDAAQRDDRRRVLTAYSRFDETPDELVIELTGDGYRKVGSKADAKQTDRLAVLATLVPTDGPGLTADELRQLWPDGGIPKPGRRAVQLDMKYGAKSGTWIASGTGTKGDPVRYRQADSIRAGPLS